MNRDLPGPQPGLRVGVDVPSDHLPGVWVDPVELLIGVPLGSVDIAPLRPDTIRSPRHAMEDEIRPALVREPCLVTFSGGRDSSVVLAIAADLARREGHAMPIAVTHRFPGVQDADETDWQELVIKHVGLDNWQKLEWTDELDAVGPFAQRSLRTTGLGAPFNQHFLLPMLDLARGGSLLTGIGGDELFVVPLRRIANRVRYRTRNARPRDLLGFLSQSAPAGLRTRRLLNGPRLDLPWVKPAVEDELYRRLVTSSVRMSARYDTALLHSWWRDRLNQVSREQTRRLAGSLDVLVQHPFTAGEVLAAFAGAYGPAGPDGRARALRRLTNGLLPDALVSRVTKASFGAAFASTWTQRFLERWTGAGVDHDMVDAEALLTEWKRPDPDARTLLLLQSAWSGDNP